MEFRVLGPLEIVEAGRRRPLAGAKERAVLACLLLEPGRVVPADDLLEAAWPGVRRAAAARSLAVRLANLRAFLEPGRPHAARSRVLVHQSGGYRLAIGPGRVDAQRLAALVRRASSAPPAEAFAAYEEALALWRGAPFPELADAPAARAEIARPRELRAQAAEGGSARSSTSAATTPRSPNCAGWSRRSRGGRRPCACSRSPCTGRRGRWTHSTPCGRSRPSCASSGWTRAPGPVRSSGGSSSTTPSSLRRPVARRPRDNISSDAENLVGSRFGDTLEGSDTTQFERYDGQAGNDTMNGRGGPGHLPGRRRARRRRQDLRRRRAGRQDVVRAAAPRASTSR